MAALVAGGPVYMFGGGEARRNGGTIEGTALSTRSASA